jgi:hypothetical protein
MKSQSKSRKKLIYSPNRKKIIQTYVNVAISKGEMEKKIKQKTESQQHAD